jgi:hypothetical protein
MSTVTPVKLSNSVPSLVCLFVCLAFNGTSAQLGYSCHTVKSYINVKTKAQIAMRFILMNVNKVINRNEKV